MGEPDRSLWGLFQRTIRTIWLGFPPFTASAFMGKPPCPKAIDADRHLGNVGTPCRLASRWVVERTFAWLGRHRRLSKDYEYVAIGRLAGG